MPQFFCKSSFIALVTHRLWVARGPKKCSYLEKTGKNKGIKNILGPFEHFRTPEILQHIKFKMFFSISISREFTCDLKMKILRTTDKVSFCGHQWLIRLNSPVRGHHRHQYWPLCQLDHRVSPAVAQGHDGVAVVVPVDDESAAAQDANEPSYCDAGQAWRILGYKHKHWHQPEGHDRESVTFTFLGNIHYLN